MRTVGIYLSFWCNIPVIGLWALEMSDHCVLGYCSLKIFSYVTLFVRGGGMEYYFWFSYVKDRELKIS